MEQQDATATAASSSGPRDASTLLESFLRRQRERLTRARWKRNHTPCDFTPEKSSLTLSDQAARESLAGARLSCSDGVVRLVFPGKRAPEPRA